MPTVTVTGRIEARAVDVWRLLTDLPGRARRHLAGPVELLTTGSFGPGTAWREPRHQPDGDLLVEEFHVVEAAPPRRLVLVSPGAGVDYRITWTLRGTRRRHRGGTLATVTLEALPADECGRVAALLLGALAARAVEHALRRDLADLAAAAEGPAESSRAA
ncbi:SRPBCC family protein [Micromonospora sp. 15K316]|uniref:SRPBCC family protein n=1 Tax=Micromonospora sp. 15K316 TaxID=2530376 RepID=UPI00104A27D9|nr:SRPBCC family protein [Micromonospora sp. 15K316]TDC30562.1 SRPBCC family protein [Micromonospora sp. 15K316]